MPRVHEPVGSPQPSTLAPLEGPPSAEHAMPEKMTLKMVIASVFVKSLTMFDSESERQKKTHGVTQKATMKSAKKKTAWNSPFMYRPHDHQRKKVQSPSHPIEGRNATAEICIMSRNTVKYGRNTRSASTTVESTSVPSIESASG